MKAGRGYLRFNKITLTTKEWPFFFDCICDNFKDLKVLRYDPKLANWNWNVDDVIFEVSHKDFTTYQEYGIKFNIIYDDNANIISPDCITFQKVYPIKKESLIEALKL